MGADDSLSLVVPLLLGILGVAFLAVWRHGSRPAGLWGCSFLLHGCAHAVSLPLDFGEPLVPALTGDAIFLVSAFFVGQALLAQFRRPARLAAHLAFVTLAQAATIYAAVGRQSLNGEVLVADFSTAALIAYAVVVSFKSAMRSIDRLLIAVSSLIVFNTVAQSLLFVTSTPADAGPDYYVGSTYVAALHMSAITFGLMLALSALGAVILDSLDGHREAAGRDPLTGLLNRRGFERAMAGMTAGSVIAGDLDRFKQVNDTYGHATGDRAIVALAQALRTGLPTEALIARFGGEEFIAFLPDRSESEATAAADGVRRAYAARNWPQLGISRGVTVSFGIAPVMPGDRCAHTAIERADAGLFAAKAAGRNRVMSGAACAPRAVPVEPMAWVSAA